jgi:hypothetical protein
LFDARAVERITLYSQGIPRLINVICDNALLIAYASSKKRVSAEMIEEVAWDLQLTVPYQIAAKTPAVDSDTPRTLDEIGRDEMAADEAVEESRQPNFADLFVREGPPELDQKRTFRGLGIGVFLGLVLTIGLGAVIYSQQSRDFGAGIAVRGEGYAQQSGNYVADLAVKAEQQGRLYLSRAKEYSRQGTSYLAELTATMAADFQRTRSSFSEVASRIGDDFQQTRNYVAQIPATMRDYSQQGRNYLSGLAVRARGSLSIQWENLKQVRLTPKTSEDNSGNARLADFHNVNQEKQIRPHVDPLGPAETLTGQRPGEGELGQEVAPEAKVGEPQTPKTSPRRADDRATGSEATDPPKPRRFEPQTAALKREPPQIERENTAKKAPATSSGHYEVVRNSFLRDKPGSAAAITATLRPGTWVRIESKDGDYLRVSSLNDPGVRGYVHREDAFFERIR